jgi:hypothetical protein
MDLLLDQLTTEAPHLNNSNGVTYVAWTWDAGSSTVTNTQGSITSQVRANASAGFSVVTYTGNGYPTGATVGHGLGVAPESLLLNQEELLATGLFGIALSINQDHTAYTVLITQLPQLQTMQANSINWNNDYQATVFSVGQAGCSN